MKTITTLSIATIASLGMAGAALAEGCFYGHTASKSTPVTADAEAPATPVTLEAAIAEMEAAEAAELETAQAPAETVSQ
ncbi:MAG: hypothetical protein AAFX39_09460 [Pseudomonadota bacterium]